jgi:hypothetical protein
VAGPRDEVWDAVAAIWHDGKVPTGQRTRVGKAVRDFKELGASPQAIRDRYDAAVLAWDGMTFGPEALVKNWKQLGGTGDGFKRREISDDEADRLLMGGDAA